MKRLLEENRVQRLDVGGAKRGILALHKTGVVEFLGGDHAR